MEARTCPRYREHRCPEACRADSVVDAAPRRAVHGGRRSGGCHQRGHGWPRGGAGHRSAPPGGKDPSIIAPDADIDAILEGNIMGGLLNCGQVCAAYTRFYVDHRRADEFAEKLAAIAGGMLLGNGLDPTTVLGPLVSQEQLDRVDGYVRAGVAEGATLL